MLAVEKWAKDKHPILAFIAPQLVVSTRDIHLDLYNLREQSISTNKLPLPPLPSWFAMYRSHRKSLNFIKTLFSESSVFSKETIEFGEAAIEAVRMRSNGMNVKPEHPPTAEDMEQVNNRVDKMLSESFRDIKDDFDKAPLASEIKENNLKLLSEMELEAKFLQRVLIPCWTLYRMHPTRLYRKARLGDLGALEKLLRLDPLMLHDPAIDKHIKTFHLRNKINAYKTLVDAPLKRPKAKINSKKMKYTFAGLISAMSILIKSPLEEPDIRALFNAVAKDADGIRKDSDLENISQDAFYRAIERDRKFWLQILLPKANKKK